MLRPCNSSPIDPAPAACMLLGAGRSVIIEVDDTLLDPAPCAAVSMRY